MQSISPTDLKSIRDDITLIDVRKPKARLVSGRALSGSVWRHPFDARNWAQQFTGHQLVICCVHGHEVSQAVCGYLRDVGLDCRYVDGGMEAMIAVGFATDELAVTEADSAGI
ncbi:MAG: rhodanese-like domain-containing protein [Pseudomonadota bacterium]